MGYSVSWSQWLWCGLIIIQSTLSHTILNMKEQSSEILPADTVSSITWISNTQVALSSWDASLWVYKLDSENFTAARAYTEGHTHAVLTTASLKGRLFSGGIDRTVLDLDLETSKSRVVGAHGNTVSAMKACGEHVLLSTSWDLTTRVW